MSGIIQIHTRIFKDKKKSGLKNDEKSMAVLTRCQRIKFRGRYFSALSETAVAFDKITGAHMPSNFYTDHLPGV